jgi:predicted acetyltransferase
VYTDVSVAKEHYSNYANIVIVIDFLVQGAGDAAASKRIWLARKKVYFFAVFSNEFTDDLSPLSKVVDIEYGTVLAS